MTDAHQPIEITSKQMARIYNAADLKAVHSVMDEIRDIYAGTRTSPPAPTHSGCDGCRKEIQHLECPTPGNCDQMKCVLCCEGSDFPTLPEEIKKYEEAAAKAAREKVQPVLEQCEASLKRAIERSNELHKMACDCGATPQNQGQYIALLESTIKDIQSLQGAQEEQE